MTVRDVESILLLLSFMILAMPVSVVGAVVLTARHMRKHFDKWMHLYGPDELKHRQRELDAENDALKVEIVELKTERDNMIAVIRIAKRRADRTAQDFGDIIPAK